MQATRVSLAQRQQLRDHGYVILQNVLSQAQVDAAKSIITAALPRYERGKRRVRFLARRSAYALSRPVES